MDIVIILVLAVISTLIAVILFSKVVLEITYKKNELDQQGEIWVKYWFFKWRVMPREIEHYEKEKALAEEEPDEEGTYWGKMKEFAAIFDCVKDDIVDILHYLTKNRILIDKFDFEFIFGLDDPMTTGMVNGLAYAVVYNILAVIHHHATLYESEINIRPDFDQVCHRVRVHCILHLKNVHIIAIIVKFVKLYYKLKKRQKKGSKNYVRTSNSRSNGHSHV